MAKAFAKSYGEVFDPDLRGHLGTGFGHIDRSEKAVELATAARSDLAAEGIKLLAYKAEAGRASAALAWIHPIVSLARYWTLAVVLGFTLWYSRGALRLGSPQTHRS
jgi:hypothetical protein